jgi:MFS family permease
MTLGLVYLVFLPSIVTTPLAGRFLDRLGTRRTMWSGLAIAAAGLPLLVMPSLAAVLAGLTLVAIGTFFAQAVATGFVGRIASFDRSTASGLYLASYFSGGLVGSFVLGRAFAAFGWTGCVVGIAVALAVAALCAGGLRRHA